MRRGYGEKRVGRSEACWFGKLLFAVQGGGVMSNDLSPSDRSQCVLSMSIALNPISQTLLVPMITNNVARVFTFNRLVNPACLPQLLGQNDVYGLT